MQLLEVRPAAGQTDAARLWWARRTFHKPQLGDYFGDVSFSYNHPNLSTDILKVYIVSNFLFLSCFGFARLFCSTLSFLLLSA